MSEPTTRGDIRTPEDVRRLVDTFYGKVRVDPVLGGIFNGVIGDRWPEHLERMYAFWGTMLLGECTYAGAPLRHHLALPIGPTHFDRWLALFGATLDDHFEGPVAEATRHLAQRIAATFLQRIHEQREGPANTPS